MVNVRRDTTISKSNKSCKSATDVIGLLHELYSAVYHDTNSFEAHRIGSDLAYLMGAIIHDNCCVWSTDQPLVVLLQRHFPPDHELWQHIGLTSTNK